MYLASPSFSVFDSFPMNSTLDPARKISVLSSENSFVYPSFDFSCLPGSHKTCYHEPAFCWYSKGSKKTVHSVDAH